MPAPLYTLDAAAQRLHIGRNNLPAGPYRGGPYMRVRRRTFRHPTRGETEYARVLFTRAGLSLIRRRLNLPADTGGPTRH